MAQSSRTTRVVTRVLQGKPVAYTTRTTRLVARLLQGRTTPRTTRTTRVTLRQIQRLYRIPPHIALPPDIPDFPPVLFPHNWVARVGLETAFLTDITSSAGSVAEERRALRTGPGRTLSVNFTTLNREDSSRLVAACLRYAHQSNVFPLYCDATVTTAPSSGNLLKCDARYKRFFPLQLILIAVWDGTRLVDEQYAYVSTILEDRMLVSDLDGVIPAGAKVYPMIEIEPMLDLVPTLLTDDKVELQLTVLEALGPHTLPPTADDDEDDLDFMQWEGGYPIFDFRVDWSDGVDVHITRSGEQYGQGRDHVVDLAGARPKFGFVFQHTFLSRPEFWEYNRFAESRRGRLNPFWVLNPQTLFKVVSIAGNDVEVEPSSPFAEDWATFIERLGILKTDGTYFMSAITSVAIDGPTQRITFTLTDAPGFGIDVVRHASSMHLCRYLRDALSEVWQTNGVVHINAEVVEILNEGDAVVAGDFPDPIT